MKKVGIIGGMSYESSLHYYERINRQVNQIKGGLSSAEMLMYSVDFERIREMMLDNRWEDIGRELSKIAQTLEAAGADFIAIATNTMHKLAGQIQSQIKTPIIHIGDCVAEECKENNIFSIGLIGTKYTMTENFLVDRLKQNGLKVAVPHDKADIDEIDRVIFDELCKGEVKVASKKFYQKVIDRMIEEDDVQGVIFGCTEIEMLLAQEDLCVPAFDTTQAHINSIVRLLVS